MARHYFIKKDGTIISIKSSRRFLQRGMGRRVSLPKISASQQKGEPSRMQKEWQEVQQQMRKHKSFMVALAIYCVVLTFLSEFYPLAAAIAVVLGCISLFSYFYFHPE